MTEDDPYDSEGVAASALDRLVQALDSASEDVDPKAIARVLLSESYRGAFPHPAVLNQLNNVIPDGAERAFSMTEREQAHRHECDKLIIESENAARKREWEDRRIVIVMTFVLLFISLGCAFYAVINGHPVGTGLAGGGALIALIGIFALRARRNRSRNPDELAQSFMSKFGAYMERKR